jgi:hypothetical protein
MRRHAWELALLAALALIGMYLLIRNHGLYPSIFADEWYYSKMVRLDPFEEALVPSWLYMWLMRAVSDAGGAQFLEAVRVANVALLLSAAPLLYATARRFIGKPCAFAIAVASTLAPLNLYTAYFMPETTYYFGFCLLAWVCLAQSHWHWAIRSAVAGGVLGLLSLVKVHALFLLPGLCLFLAHDAWLHSSGATARSWIGRALSAAALAVTVTVTLKFGLGWAIAGEAGLHLFGQFYGRAATTVGNSMFDMLVPTLITGKGHLATLALLTGLPLVVLVYHCLTQALRRPDALMANAGGARNPAALTVYTVLMLGAPVALAILYTASLNFMGHDELMRLHLRYYSFAFPLLWMAAAVVTIKERHTPLLRWALALGMCSVLVMAVRELPAYRLLMVDGPDIVSIAQYPRMTMVLALLQGALVLGWAFGLRAMPLLFVFIALPASLLAGQIRIGQELQVQGVATPADRSGQAALRLVPLAERDTIVVASDNPQFIMRAQFQIDHQHTTMLMLPPGGASIDDVMLPEGKGWFVMLGPNPLPPRAELVETGAGWRLFKFGARTNTLVGREIGHATLSDAFERERAAGIPGVIERVEGFSHGEPWGRWSMGKQVTLHLTRPLPRKAGLLIDGQSFGINTTLSFVARAGAASTAFRIGGAAQRVAMRLDTDGNTRTLVIEIPQPQSPAQLGNPDDARMLGIGLRTLTLIDLEQAP